MKGFKLPFVSNISPEKEHEFEAEAKLELTYETEKNKRIEMLFQNKNSVLRKVADYLWVNINKPVSYEQMAKELNLTDGAVRLRVGELNFYNKFPITMMPIPKMKGWIQSILDDEENYEKWDMKKMRTITSMSAVRTKANKTTKAKRETRTKAKELVVVQEA